MAVHSRVFLRISACLHMVSVKKDILTKLISSNGFKLLVEDYNVALTIILAIATILVIILLILNITKLSASLDNEMKRHQALSGILVCGVCLALLVSIDLIYAIILAMVLGFSV